MNTFFQKVEDKIDNFAQQLKGLLGTFSTIFNGQQLMELEQKVEHLSRNASGELFGFALKEHLENPDLRCAALQTMHGSGKKWKSKGLREARLRLSSGIVITVKTPYFVTDRKGSRGRKRKKRGKKGSGCFPVLKALGIHERMTPAALEKIARMVTICSSLAEFG